MASIPRASPRRRLLSAGLIAMLLLVGALGFVVAFAGETLPSIDRLGSLSGSVRILDRHGALIAQVELSGAHDTVPLSQVAPVMQAAIIAAEDRHFFVEGALDPVAIVRAFATDLLHGRAAQGASTITQQLAHNAFLLDDRSPLRKLREALLADEIEQRYTKPQILQMYLDTIYLGHGAYGIEEAAQTYFGVHASQLSLAQAALIAGLPQAPSLDDPFVDPSAAFARMHYVLGQMVSAGMISANQAADVDPLLGSELGSAASNPALVAARAQHQQAILASLHDTFNQVSTDLAPHFVTYVRDQLDQLFQLQPDALSGGVTVQTTLDLPTQLRAQQAVSKGIATIGRNANNGALLMLDPHSGDILAMVGSANYHDASIAGEFNVVTGQRQPGSSFKPYVYEQAFRSGTLSPWSVVDDTAAESAQLGGVQDWDRTFMGQMPAWQALLLSRNVPTEQVMEKTGTRNVIAFAHSLGITSDLADNASTGIGTSAVRMIDHAAAYAAFANGGTTVQPRAIVSVTDAGGHLLYQAPQQRGAQAMTPQQAYLVTGILRHYNAQWGDGIHRDVACKSGTTDNFTDAWFMAYTPGWVVATWVGHTSGTDPAEVGMNTVYGNDVGQAIAAPFINGLAPSGTFVAPPGSPQLGGVGPGTGPSQGEGGRQHGKPPKHHGP